MKQGFEGGVARKAQARVAETDAHQYEGTPTGAQFVRIVVARYYEVHREVAKVINEKYGLDIRDKLSIDVSIPAPNKYWIGLGGERLHGLSLNATQVEANPDVWFNFVDEFLSREKQNLIAEFTPDILPPEAAARQPLPMGDPETIDNFAARKDLTVAELETAVNVWKAARSATTKRQNDFNTVMGEVARCFELPVQTVQNVLEAARAAQEATQRGPKTKRPKKTRRLKWNVDNGPDENPAAFAWRAYQAEAKAGTLHMGVIRQDDKENGTDLAVKLFSWLRSPANRKQVPEGFDIPTKPEWNTRQLAKLSGEAARDVLRLYEVAKKRKSKHTTLIT